jgi:hypothetical protein
MIQKYKNEISDKGKLGESQGRKATGATVKDYASQLPKG